MRRGEVWWAESPRGGRRPHLILTRTAAIPVLHQLVCVPATRTIRWLPTEVRLDRDDGMPEECALTFDNVTPMPRAWLTERICTLGEARLREVCRALSHAVDC